MGDARQRAGAGWRWAVWALLAAVAVAGSPLSARAGDDAAELQVLLAELRDLREARHRLRRQAAEEQADLDRELRAVAADRADAAADAAAATADLAAARAQLEGGQPAAGEAAWQALDQWLAGLPAALQAQAGSQAILLDAAFFAGWPAADGTPLPARLAQALSNVEAALQRARTVDVSRQVIDLPGAGGAPSRLEGEVLRLGGAAEYLVTADGSTCAWRAADGVWRPLPASDAAAIRLAIRVARREAPPQLVALPVPEVTP